MRLIAPTVRRHGWRLCSLLVWRSETAITVDFNGVCDGISPDGFGWGDVRRKVVLKEGFQGILTGVKEEKPEMEKGKGRGKKKKREREGDWCYKYLLGEKRDKTLVYYLEDRIEGGWRCGFMTKGNSLDFSAAQKSDTVPELAAAKTAIWLSSIFHGRRYDISVCITPARPGL